MGQAAINIFSVERTGVDRNPWLAKINTTVFQKYFK